MNTPCHVKTAAYMSTYEICSICRYRVVGLSDFGDSLTFRLSNNREPSKFKLSLTRGTVHNKEKDSQPTRTIPSASHLSIKPTLNIYPDIVLAIPEGIADVPTIFF